MSRILKRPIQLTGALQNGRPSRFVDRDVEHHVTTLVNMWTESGDWIKVEPHRNLYRVLTDRNVMPF